jgi:hypothetical protein
MASSPLYYALHGFDQSFARARIEAACASIAPVAPFDFAIVRFIVDR